ncbi:unnamed protein product [Effrenium voratum]|nr:unnamed protein product [Effrenium voratum]
MQLDEVKYSTPLVGMYYSLKLLSEESKDARDSLDASQSLLRKVIARSDDSFSHLSQVKTYLQQISVYLMEHLVSRVWSTVFRDWKAAEEVSQAVLQEFGLLMSGQETGAPSSMSVMGLLNEYLPPPDASIGWDTPFLACLADALSLTAQLGEILSKVAEQAISKRKSAKKALEILQKAFNEALKVMEASAPQSRAQIFVALVLARELMVHSVGVVEKALQEENPDKFGAFLDCFVRMLQVACVRGLPALALQETQLCTYKGQKLRVNQLPTAFASLYMVAATRRRERPVPTDVALRQLFEVVAEKAGQAGDGPVHQLHQLLHNCQAEAVAASNSLGLSMLLPEAPEVKDLLHCVDQIGSEEAAASEQSVAHFTQLCADSRNKFRDLLRCMRAVGEMACMQRSAADDETADKALRISARLPDVLGAALQLFQVGETGEAEHDAGEAEHAAEGRDEPLFDWNRDLLDMTGDDAWRSSILAHVVCLLGATQKEVIRKQDLPPAVLPFAAFVDLDAQALNTTYWPGVPDNSWHGLRYSGMFKHNLPPNGNIVWAECECGYRYCYAECGAPVSQAPCASPEGQGRCTRQNGGQNYNFAAGQRLIAVVVTAAPHGDGWPPIYHAVRQYNEAFSPPGNRPGLFALTEADLETSVKRENRTAVSNSLMTETVRQDWNEPLGKPPPANTGLDRVTFRVLHLLIHASALISVGMQWVQQGPDSIVNLLQEHLRREARMNPVRDANDTVWYFMANLEADLQALSKLLKKDGIEVATLFVHAVLHRLGDLEPGQQPAPSALRSHEERVAYENWFHEIVVLPVLGEITAAGDYTLPGVHDLRRRAGQTKDPNVVLTTDMLARRAPPADAWGCMEDRVRRSMLLHLMRPLIFPVAEIAESTYEELVAASNGGRGLTILRLAMAGFDESKAWKVQAELLRAASLAWVLPFMRYVREKEGGRIDIRAARRTTMRQWLDMRDDHERLHAWSLFRNCEAAWNATLAAGNVQVGCGHLTLPEWTADSPLALSCPVVDPEKLRHGDLAIGNYAHPPEHCAAVALHELALNHNKVLAHIHKYLEEGDACHIRARVHPAAKRCTPSGQCQPADLQNEQVRLVQHTVMSDLFVFPGQMETTCVEDSKDSPAEAPHVLEGDEIGPRTFRLDYNIDSLLQTFYHVPWGADCPARGDHDFPAMENDLALRLVAGRPPLQVCSEDHKEFQSDIDPFPYNIFHGDVNVRILTRVKSCQVVPQMSLRKALSVQRAEQLETDLYRDTAHALEVSKITGDLITLLLGVRTTSIFRSDMTLLEFINLLLLVDQMAPKQVRQCESHPDALKRIESMQDIATIPLNALVALHLLSRDILAMTRGVSIKTKDSDAEYADSKELPEDMKSRMEGLKKEFPQALPVACRLVARCAYLASELPSAIRDPTLEMEAPSLCMMAQEMDVVDELEEVIGEEPSESWEELVPSSLLCWNECQEGHVLEAVKMYRECWREIREPFLAPPKPVLGAADPAVGGGMVTRSSWQKPQVGGVRRQPRKKREVAGLADSSDSSDDWALIGTAPAQREARALACQRVCVVTEAPLFACFFHGEEYEACQTETRGIGCCFYSP